MALNMSESDDGSFDPNTNVPQWVTITISIATVLLFVIVLVFLYFTNYELSVETLERLAKKLPFCHRSFEMDLNVDTNNESNALSKTANDKKRISQPQEHVTIFMSEGSRAVGRIHTYGAVGQHNLRSGFKNPSYVARHTTVITFESNV